jgi:hypothetical protein
MVVCSVGAGKSCDSGKEIRDGFGNNVCSFLSLLFVDVMLVRDST